MPSFCPRHHGFRFTELSVLAQCKSVVLLARSGDTRILLSVIKNHKKEQVAKLKFDNGKIDANFDNKTATITHEQNETKLSIHEDYNDKYDVQTDLVYTCYANSSDPSTMDGLDNQLEVLRWMLQKIDEHSETQLSKEGLLEISDADWVKRKYADFT